MKALTLTPTWAWAVAHGGKRIENRTWRAPSAIIGERIAIHAGVGRDAGAAEWIYERTGVIVPADFTRGAIVATARIVAMVDDSNSPWFVGPVGWVLDDVRALAEPVPCRGALCLWRVPDAISASLP